MLNEYLGRRCGPMKMDNLNRNKEKTKLPLGNKCGGANKHKFCLRNLINSFVV